MKKALALLLAVVLVVGCFAACSGNNGGETPKDTANYSNVKVGLICLHSEESTYDKNFLNGMEEAKKNLGLTDDQVIIVKNIAESNDCYETAADLVDEGCNVIFADSFGHETYLLKAAEEFPEVQFCHATGTQAHVKGLDNYHNAFAAIYEGRYLAGVAAGLKLNEMIESGKITADKAKMGYVGAFTYAEVISGYSSFYLGAKSVCPSVTMDVQFTGSWYDETAEKTTALALINNGCVLISQHADSMGAPSACEEKNVPNVSYNGSTVESCPNTHIISSRINWAPYFEYMVKCVATGEKIATDWTGTIATNSVVLSDLNTKAAAEGTQEKLDAVKAQLVDGSISVFDTKNFTVKGETLKEYLADVDGDYTGETNVINENGIFVESGDGFRSAPYFDLEIDGITRLNVNFG